MASMISLFKNGIRIRSHLSTLSIRHFASVTKCDAVVLGGGIGGASVSYRLAQLQNLNVICLEKEDTPGYHATGKAFGIFAESNARCLQSKILTAASRSFFESPDEECVDSYIRDNFEQGILTKTGLLAISSPQDYPYLYTQFGPRENLKIDQNIHVYPHNDVTNLVPFLNTQELAENAIYEPNAANFHIGLVYEHFLVGGNAVGVEYYFNQSAVEISKNNAGNWEIMSYNAETNSIDRFEAAILVNCTGEWGDETAKKAGITPLGLVAEKRNIIVFTYENPAAAVEQENKQQSNVTSTEAQSQSQTPWLGWISPNVGEVFYSCFQGGNGVFLYNDCGCEENIVCDIRHDEMEIVLHKIAKYTTLKIKKVASKTAGIRCSTNFDNNIVIGPSLDDASFVWCAALGSYGVQLSPAYSEIVSYLAVGKGLPNKYIDVGVDVNCLLPARLY